MSPLDDPDYPAQQVFAVKRKFASGSPSAGRVERAVDAAFEKVLPGRLRPAAGWDRYPYPDDLMRAVAAREKGVPL